MKNINIIVEHIVRNMLSEGKNASRIKEQCRNVMRDYFINTWYPIHGPINNLTAEKWLNSEFEHVDNPNHLSYLEYMLYHFLEKFFYHRQGDNDAIYKLAPVICNIAFRELRFQQDKPETRKQKKLLQIVMHLDESLREKDINFNVIRNAINFMSANNIDGITFDTFNKIYGVIIDKMYKDENEYLDVMTNPKNEKYTVVGPLSFVEAQKYGNLSNPEGKICYTQQRGTWEQFTEDNEYNVYVLLKNGWENIEPNLNSPGLLFGEEYTGYNEYGLSMIFMIVDPEDGDLMTCNTRWNHDGRYYKGNCDFALRRKDIAELIGIENCREIFRPQQNSDGYINETVRRVIKNYLR